MSIIDAIASGATMESMYELHGVDAVLAAVAGYMDSLAPPECALGVEPEMGRAGHEITGAGHEITGGTRNTPQTGSNRQSEAGRPRLMFGVHVRSVRGVMRHRAWVRQPGGKRHTIGTYPTRALADEAIARRLDVDSEDWWQDTKALIRDARSMVRPSLRTPEPSTPPATEALVAGILREVIADAPHGYAGELAHAWRDIPGQVLEVATDVWGRAADDYHRITGRRASAVYREALGRRPDARWYRANLGAAQSSGDSDYMVAFGRAANAQA